MTRFTLILSVALLMPTLAGCKKESSPSAAAPPPSRADVSAVIGAAPTPPEPKVMDWLLGVLQQHQITAQRTRDWITFAGSDIAISAGFQPKDPKSPKRDDFVVLQVNFSVRLPGGRMIIQPVAGFGETQDAALAHAEASFLLGTFHALLGAFVDPDEKHVHQQQRTISGRQRFVTFGGIVGKQYGATQPTSPADDVRWQQQFFSDLDALGVPPGTHWIDVYNGFVNGKQVLEIQLDNKRWPELEGRMRTAPWPHIPGNTLTSVRQFLLVQDVDDATRPKPRPATRPAAGTQPSASPGTMPAMPAAEGFQIRVLQGLRAHFNQPSGPSRQGTDWAISLGNSKGERRILVRTYADEVGPISQEQEARLALEYVGKLIQSGWTPDQYRGEPGELVVPKRDGGGS